MVGPYFVHEQPLPPAHRRRRLLAAAAWVAAVALPFIVAYLGARS